MTTESILLAFILTLIAGLSTGLGGLIAFFSKRDNVHFLTTALGFSAGVMLFVSFVDIFPEALEGFTTCYGEKAMLATCLTFFGGMGLIALIDFLIPEGENPHEMNYTEQIAKEHNMPNEKKFHRMGIMLALSIAIHNFPSGEIGIDIRRFANLLSGKLHSLDGENIFFIDNADKGFGVMQVICPPGSPAVVTA